VSCDIYNIGDDGAKIFGGDRKTLIPAGNYGINNHVYRFSRINRTYRSAISLDGVGNRAGRHECGCVATNQHKTRGHQLRRVGR